MTERELHEVCVGYLRWKWPSLAFHHSPNEGKRGWNAQRDMKALGTYAGWPDLQILDPKGRHLYVELKAENGRLRLEQNICIQDLRERGITVHIIKSFDGFKELIERWVIGDK